MREGLVIGRIEGEDDRLVVLGLDRLHRTQQGCRAVGVVDLDDALEGEDNALGRQRVAVGELESVLDRAGVFGRLRVVTLRRGIGGQCRAAFREVQQILIDLSLDLKRAVVIGAGRVDRDHLVGRADNHSRARIRSFARTACRERHAHECRTGEEYGPSTDLLHCSPTCLCRRPGHGSRRSHGFFSPHDGRSPIARYTQTMLAPGPANISF